MINESNKERRYDYIVVGTGAAGSVLAGELSASGAQVLVIESGGPDAPTILEPSIWFYNVAGPLDYHLPIVPSPRLNNRNFNMALGHVLGGGFIEAERQMGMPRPEWSSYGVV
jgi:choline dehydrogenase